MKKISTLTGIIIIIIVAVVCFGGALAYEYFLSKDTNSIVAISKTPSLISFNIIPSDKSGQGITYPDGAKAQVKANNVSRVEFRQLGGGTDIYTSPEGGLVGTGIETMSANQQLWELALPSDRVFTELCALGFDSHNNKVGEICLNNVANISDQTNDSNDGWQTYANTQYGFSIQYPSQWSPAPGTSMGKSIQTLLDTNDYCVITIVSLPGNDPNVKSLEQDNSFAQTTTNIGGVEAQIFTQKNLSLAGNTKGAYFSKNGIFYDIVLQEGYGKKIHNECVTTFDTMLSTFQFTN